MDNQIKKAVFFESLLQFALEKKENGEKITPVLESLSSKTHFHPIKGEITISLSSLFRLMRKYKCEGIDGLLTQQRCDKGKPRKISTEIIEKAKNLRKDNYCRTTRKLINILEMEFGITGIKESTLNYHLHNHGYSRRQLSTLTAKVHIRFESKAPNDLWIGDYHDKRSLFPLQGGRFAYLSAFIDCHSRFIVHGQYYLLENITTLEDSFKKAILKWGAPSRVFVDNAKIYRSHRFSYACSKLGVKKIFSTAYVKESRGKIEKFFQYVKENFEQEAIHRGGFKDVDELNQYFWAWLEMDYHQKVHSTTGQTPNERYKTGFERKNVDLNIMHELFLLVDDRKVHPKTATVSILGQNFQCEGFLSGRKVEVHYNPNDLSYVIIYYNKKMIHRAFPQEINKPLPRVEQQASSSLKYDYLAALEGKYQEILGKSLLTLSLSKEENKTTVDYNYLSFKNDLQQNLDIRLSKEQERKCLKFYESYQPLHQQSVIQGILYAKAQLQQSPGAPDLDFYIKYIKIFVLNQKSK